MILLGIDLETTGLDKNNDEITEISWAVFDTAYWKKPLSIQSFYVLGEKPINTMIEKLTGITDSLREKAGIEFTEAYIKLLADMSMHNVDFMVAQNASFDREFLEVKIHDLEDPIPHWEWIDTQADIPFDSTVKNRNLIGLCAEHGFLNPFPHSALFDVMSMMKMLSFYDIAEVLKFKYEPMIYLKAHVDYKDKDLAKQARFSWENANNLHFPKTWVKAVKQRYVKDLIPTLPFAVESIDINSLVQDEDTQMVLTPSIN